MRSKTSFFNKTLFQKNLTRFAPLWGLYALILLLWTLLMVMDGSIRWDDKGAVTVEQAIRGLAVLHCAYGGLLAAGLFGDLFSSRMCNGIHSLPICREAWFGTNVVSGLLMGLVPAGVTALAMYPVVLRSVTVESWLLPLLWLAVAVLGFLFFFGTGIFSAVCTGNWLGMAVMYGIVNMGGYALLVLADTFLTPLLYGVQTNQTIFYQFCPVLTMGNGPYLLFEPVWNEAEMISCTYRLGERVWETTGVYGLVGLALTAVSLLIYRKRDLESAGDFAAVRFMEPVLSVFVAVTGTAFLLFLSMTSQLGYGSARWVILGAGLVICWFGGRMVIERTTRVFRKRNLLGLGAVVLGVAVTMGVTALDPFGIADWVPETEEIQQIIFWGPVNATEVQEPEYVEMVRQIHQLAKEERVEDGAAPGYTFIEITYELENGLRARRGYGMDVNGPAGQLYRQMTSSVRVIFDPYSSCGGVTTDEAFRRGVGEMTGVFLESELLPEEVLTPENQAALLDAILADCAEGTLSQGYAFHPEVSWAEPQEGQVTESYRMEIDCAYPPNGEKDRFHNLYFTVFADSRNVLAWLDSVGVSRTQLREAKGYAAD